MKDNDLIRRGDAFTLFQKQYIDTQEGTDHVAIRINIGITKCIHAMQDIPAVDAVEVRHAYWEAIERKSARICSRCEKDEPYKFADDDADVFDYCPHCGARMDGKEEHNAAD